MCSKGRCCDHILCKPPRTSKQLSCSDADPPTEVLSCHVLALLALQRLWALARARGHRHFCMYVCTFENRIGSGFIVFAVEFRVDMNNEISVCTFPLTQSTCIQSNITLDRTPRQIRVSMTNGSELRFHPNAVSKSASFVADMPPASASTSCWTMYRILASVCGIMCAKSADVIDKARTLLG